MATGMHWVAKFTVCCQSMYETYVCQLAPSISAPVVLFLESVVRYKLCEKEKGNEFRTYVSMQSLVY